jgi:3-oxoacyl-[acyl-carrier protein] reductase
MISDPHDSLTGVVAVVTGGSRGIGAGICRLLAAHGARVAVNGRDETAIAATVEAIRRAGGEAIGVAADCTDFTAIERLRQEVERQLGPAGALIANVGGGGRWEPIAELTEERWRALVDLNLTSAFLTLKSFLPGMIERRRGSIVTLSSTAGRQPSQASNAYAAAKAGVIMLTRQVAQEGAPAGVRVNCIAPGPVLTEDGALAAAPEEVRQQVAESLPLRRVGTAEDVARAALFLASESSSWITGAVLDVAGGKVMV